PTAVTSTWWSPGCASTRAAAATTTRAGRPSSGRGRATRSATPPVSENCTVARLRPRCGRAGVQWQGRDRTVAACPPRSPSLTAVLAERSRARSGNHRAADGVDRAVVSRPPPTEAALVARARGGDAVAYEALVRAHQDIA